MARILLVDDSPNQRSRIVGILVRARHEVHAAEDWATCRAMLHKGTPDLVLLDVNLPGMQSGDILAMQLKKHPQLSNAVIVFHSAAKEEDLKKMVARSGADGYIPKGGTEQAFLSAIDGFLAPKTPSG